MQVASDVAEREDRRWHENKERLMDSLADRAMVLMAVLLLSGIICMIGSLIPGFVNLVSYLFFVGTLVVISLSGAYMVFWFKANRKVIQGWNQILKDRETRRRAAFVESRSNRRR